MKAKISSRGSAVSAAIAAHKPFATHGALRGIEGHAGEGRLCGDDRDAFLAAYQSNDPIVYSVYSYQTPIAWVRKSGKVHIVKQRFSVTTSKHQGKLYALSEQVTP